MYKVNITKLSKVISITGVIVNTALIIALILPITYCNAASKHSRKAQPYLKSAVSYTKPGRFITDLAYNPIRGGIWVATEEHGVWYVDSLTSNKSRANKKHSSKSIHWIHYTAKNTKSDNKKGLADNHIYALACDKLGRIWVGTLNHGVSVYNGKSWENYGVLDGPLGGRVFDIAICPVDDSVWIATSAGLTRYAPENNTWTYYTQRPHRTARRNYAYSSKTPSRSALAHAVLPSNQIQAIAFAQDGTIYVGTQCNGLTICHPQKSYGSSHLAYKNWHTVTSRFVKRPPLLPMGGAWFAV